jgi:hypothetical protein
MAVPTDLPVRTISASSPLTETAKVAADTANGNSFINGPTVWLEATSTAGGTITVTTPYTVGGLSITDLVITLTGAQTKRMGPFDPAVYGPTVTLTASAATITLAIYQLGGPGS